MFYVYGLLRPSGRVFYIGKGKDDRMYNHVREAKRGYRSHKCNIIRKIWREGGDVGYCTYWAGEDEAEAFEQEKYWIAFYGIETLTNKSIGGDGPTGYKHSAQTRRRMSKYRTEQNLQRWKDPEYRRHISEKRKEQMQDPAHRELSREAGRRLWENPEYRRHMAEVASQCQQGEKNGRAKLTWDQVHEIRQRYADGQSLSRIAKSFGIAKSTVSQIVNSKHWIDGTPAIQREKGMIDAEIIYQDMQEHGPQSSWDWEADLRFAWAIGASADLIQAIQSLLGSQAPTQVQIAFHRETINRPITSRRIRALQSLIRQKKARSWPVGTGRGGLANFGRKHIRCYELVNEEQTQIAATATAFIEVIPTAEPAFVEYASKACSDPELVAESKTLQLFCKK